MPSPRYAVRRELWRSVSLWSGGAIVFLRIIVCAQAIFAPECGCMNEAAKCFPDAIFGVRTFILQGRV